MMFFLNVTSITYLFLKMPRYIEYCRLGLYIFEENLTRLISKYFIHMNEWMFKGHGRPHLIL